MWVHNTLRGRGGGAWLMPMAPDCTPYLLSLGLTKGQTSMVWLVGPLSGLIVQPIVGVMSDQTQSEWGRRRPYILVCSLVVAISFIGLGFTKEMVSAFVSDPSTVKTL